MIWSIFYQQIENNLIQPRIQSRAVDMQPFIVLVAVLFGSTLFGILGALAGRAARGHNSDHRPRDPALSPRATGGETHA
ncbi:MAG: AI-2E family transporter [Solirubrobacteraceae bacterium]